nr:MAG TPA: hypothetical protein [Caudoviricetes sp.]
MPFGVENFIAGRGTQQLNTKLKAQTGRNRIVLGESE